MPRWRMVVLLLVLGAIVNVAVAMACARWGGVTTIGQLQVVEADTVPAHALIFLNDPAYRKSFGSGRQTGLTERTAHGAVMTRVEYTRWYDSPEPGNYSRTQEQGRFGWPFRALQYTNRMYWDWASYEKGGYWRVEGWRGGWPLAPDQRTQTRLSARQHPAFVYPLEPLPLGFVANTLIYAALLWPPLLALGRVKRRRRRTRGLCVRCKYPVGASAVCTECGAAVR